MVQNRSCNELHELWHQAGYRFYGKGPWRWNANWCNLCNRGSCKSIYTWFSWNNIWWHPVCCAAALAEVGELLDRDLAGNAKKVGDYFAAKLEKLPHVKEVRHQGLLVGVEFDDTISGVDVKHGAFDRKMLITAIGAHIIRMVPPLIVSEEECDKAFEILDETVKSLS